MFQLEKQYTCDKNNILIGQLSIGRYHPYHDVYGPSIAKQLLMDMQAEMTAQIFTPKRICIIHIKCSSLATV